MATKRLGKLIVKNCGLFLCDMQEKFRPSIQYFPQIVATSNRLLQAAKILDMPVVITEQYPKGLGPTVPELDIGDLPAPIFPKTKFSMALPEVEEHLAKNAPDMRTVILCGIETQACIQQTVLDLLERDYEVHVLADCVSSRSMVDRLYALERVKDAGAYITTSEAVLLSLVQGSAHPKFREVQKLIFESAPDSGLLTHQPDPNFGQK